MEKLSEQISRVSASYNHTIWFVYSVCSKFCALSWRWMKLFSVYILQWCFPDQGVGVRSGRGRTLLSQDALAVRNAFERAKRIWVPRLRMDSIKTVSKRYQQGIMALEVADGTKIYSKAISFLPFGMSTMGSSWDVGSWKITQSESSSERSSVESSDEFENYPGRSQKLDTKLAWHLMTFTDMCMSNLLVCHAKQWNPWSDQLGYKLGTWNRGTKMVPCSAM